MKNIKKLILFITMIIAFSGFNIYAATVGDALEQPEAGWKRYDVLIDGTADSRITYEGDWAGEYYSYKTTNFIKFNFVGTELRLIRRLSSYSSKNLSVTIDGVNYQTDNNDAMPEYTPVIMFEITNLSDIEHTVVIDTTTADSTHHVSLDYIDINEDGELKSYNESPIKAPTNLVATASKTEITLNWEAVSDADSYTVLRSTTSSSVDTVIATNITEITYIDTNVTPGVTYYYVVRAVKNDIESTDSNIATVMIEENTNFANLQIKLSTTDIYEYRMTMSDIDKFMNWYIDRSNGTGLPFYSFSDNANIEPYTDINEYLMFDKIVWFKVKEYLK